MDQVDVLALLCRVLPVLAFLSRRWHQLTITRNVDDQLWRTKQRATVDQIVELVQELSPLEKLELLGHLAPDLAAPPKPALTTDGVLSTLDNLYQQGYERVPEDIADVEALLPHLPIPMERWE